MKMPVSKFAGIALAALCVSATAVFADDRDDKIEKSFKDSYSYRTDLKDADVSISADSGVVTLKGKVNYEEQRRLAEDTARGLPGVATVNNEIKVRNEPKESSDDWIALKVRSSLVYHKNVGLRGTDVAVNSGVVTLTGVVNNDAEKALAAEYAGDIKGVTRVDNQLKVAPSGDRTIHTDTTNRDLKDVSRRDVGDKIDDASITARIKSSLAVRRSTSALRTEVTTLDGVVTVRGEAKNAAEKDLVSKIASDIQGVRSVNNEMSVRN